MKTILFAMLLLSMMGGPVLAQNALYNITEGKLQNGKTYTGTVEFAQVGPNYALKWKTSAGVYDGMALSVPGGFGGSFGSGAALAVYTRLESGNLDGKWCLEPGKVGVETVMARATESKLVDGTYPIEGKNADGSGAYKGTLAIKQLNGEVYSLTWTTGGGSVQKGLGIYRNNVLVSVVAGSGDYGCIFYEELGKGKLYGKWTTASSPTLATENLSR